MSVKPVFRPNVIRQTVLAALVANSDKGLSKNVSDLSVERLAARWSR